MLCRVSTQLLVEVVRERERDDWISVILTGAGCRVCCVCVCVSDHGPDWSAVAQFFLLVARCGLARVLCRLSVCPSVF